MNSSVRIITNQFTYLFYDWASTSNILIHISTFESLKDFFLYRWDSSYNDQKSCCMLLIGSISVFCFSYIEAHAWKVCIIYYKYSTKTVEIRNEALAQICVYLLIFTIPLAVDFSIPVIRQNAALVYWCMCLLLSITSNKLIISSLAKMGLSIIKWEYCITAGYFYYQWAVYDGSKRSQELLIYSLYATVLVYSALWTMLFLGCLSQISNKLDLYWIKINTKKLHEKQ